MKRVALTVLCGLTLWCPAPAVAAVGAAAKRIAALERKALPPFALPKVLERRLAGGMRCFLLPDRTLPLMRFQLYLATGRVFDPADRVGLNDLMLGLLRSGGTRAHRATEVDEALEQRAITIQFEPGNEVSSVEVGAMSEMTEEALTWAAELLREPAFETERIALAKGLAIEAIRRQNDTPTEIVHREFRKVVYGPESPWARSPDAASIGAITADDLVRAHARLAPLARATCAAAGDFDPEAFVALLNRLFPGAPVPEAVLPSAPPAPIAWQAGTWLAERRAAQAAVTIGHRATDRWNPDKYALVVMNEILGSGQTFSSWLTSMIRTAKGLAYEVWSHYGFGPKEAAGIFQIHAKTRPEKVGEVIRLARDLVAKMADGVSVTEPDVRRMKESIRKRSVFEYEEPFHVATETARFVYLGFPPDYLQVYQRGIDAVTLADVRRVATQYLRPDALQVLIVGERAKMGESLSPLGPIAPYPLQ
ncbi:MAG: insulinase family protein [Deltaproteobacteria bacterium]|nr:insulinase family protein [Deltaproteobacteria bacterium]